MIVKDLINEMIDNWDDNIIKIYDHSIEFKRTIFDLWDEYIASPDEDLIGLRLQDNVMEHWNYKSALSAVFALEMDLNKKTLSDN